MFRSHFSFRSIPTNTALAALAALAALGVAAMAAAPVPARAADAAGPNKAFVAAEAAATRDALAASPRTATVTDGRLRNTDSYCRALGATGHGGSRPALDVDCSQASTAAAPAPGAARPLRPAPR